MLIKRKLLTPNRWSRPGSPEVSVWSGGKLKAITATMRVEGVALHWVENPGTDAEFNWRFFESRKDGVRGYGSAHYIVDAKTVLHAVPDDEVAFHVGSGQPYPDGYTQKARRWAPYPSARLIGVEMCHPDWTGRFEPETLQNAIWLVTGLCLEYDLNPDEDIVRHFDVTGKRCPKWFVEHEKSFAFFKDQVALAKDAVQMYEE